jgi:hypothetical protein
MALTNLNDIVPYPNWPRGLRDVNTTFSSLSADSATDQVAFAIRLIEAGTIDKVHMRVSTMTGIQSMRVAFQDLDAEGKPDGTDTHFRVYTTTGSEDNTVITTGLMTTDGTDIGTKKTVAVGDKFAVVISLPSWTTGKVSWSYVPGPSDTYQFSFGWFSSNSGSSWGLWEVMPVMGIEFDDGSYPFLANTVLSETLASPSIDSGTTPDEYALKLTVPVPMRATGVFFKGSTASNTRVTLYDSIDTVLGGGVLTPDIQQTTHIRTRQVFFATPVELVAGDVYRIAWNVADLTNRFYWTMDFPVAAQRKILPNGLNMQLSEREDAGAWTDTDTEMSLAGFLVDQLGDDAGGGGGGCDYGGLANGTRVLPLAGA